MATLTEMLSGTGGRLGQAFNDPWTQLGMQMLQASGPQANDPSFGARFGQAGAGFMQAQQQAAQLQQQQLLRQVQMGQLAKQARSQETEEQARKRMMEMIAQDPTMLANNPLARAWLETTGDVSGLKGLADFGPKTPGAPKMPWQFEQKLPTGEAVQHIYDPESGGYQAGSPYRPTAQQNVDIRGAQLGLGRQQWETEMQFKERQAAEKAQQFQQSLGQREQQFGAQQQFRETEAQRKQGNWTVEQERAQKAAETAARQAETAAEKEQRQQRAETLKNTVERSTLRKQFVGATSQIDQAQALAKQVLNHPGLSGNFGKRGMVPNIPGSDAADAAAVINRLRSVGGLQEIIKLKNSGVSFGQLSNFEQEQAQKAFINLEKAQSVEQARESLRVLVDSLGKLKQNMTTDYEGTDRLYELPTRQQPQAQQPTGAPAVGTVEDGYEFMGGNPADPRSWRKR